MGFEGTIQAIGRQMQEYLSAGRCTIRVPRGNVLKIITAYGIMPEQNEEEVAMDMATIAGQAALTKQIVLIPNFRHDIRYDPSYINNEEINALVAIPLIFEDIVYGVAQIYTNESLSDQQLVLANALSQSAALTLYHIEVSKMNRQAILDVMDPIFECASLKEMFIKAVEVISKRLEVESCLIYKIFPRFASKNFWCEIVAGVPPGEHEIGLANPLDIRQHQDIKLAVDSRELIVLNPLTHEKTEHLRDLARNRKIRAILLDPLIVEDKDNGSPEGEVIGVLVIEARKEKLTFSAEERSFVFDAGKIIAKLIKHDRAHDKTLNTFFEEIEHNLLNPGEVMAGFAEKSFEPILEICDVADNICAKHPECNGARQICDSKDKIAQNAMIIKTAAKKLRSSAIRIKNRQLEAV